MSLKDRLFSGRTRTNGGQQIGTFIDSLRASNSGPFIDNISGLPMKQAEFVAFLFLGMLKLAEGRNKEGADRLENLVKNRQLRLALAHSVIDLEGQETPLAFGVHLEEEGASVVIAVNTQLMATNEQVVEILMSERLTRFFTEVTNRLDHLKRNDVPLNTAEKPALESMQQDPSNRFYITY